MRCTILDGEIVRPGPDGRPLFYELMRRRGPFCFYAFDLLWLDGSDLRQQPLLDRKRALRKLLPLKPRAVRYVEHVASGTELFRAICELDMEGIVAKQGGRSIHAGGDDLGEDQEPRLQSGGWSIGLLRPRRAR
jgi:bifunctional non-homologous end joining protein LigD